MQEIQQRLNSIRDDSQYWRIQLYDIKKKMSEYERHRRQKPGGNNEQILHGILPTYWKVFHTHNISRRESGDLLPDYDVGIFLVGYSSIPIALSLAEINPREEIYFIYSNETTGVLQEINQRIQAMLQPTNSSLVELVQDTVLRNTRNTLEINSPSNPVETFKQIKRIIDEVGDKRIALDITGGKKTMIGGGFTAGSILGFGDSVDMFYVDSLEYNVNRGRPEWGTEFLSKLENPYDIYNVQSVQQAEKLFEKHNYEAAADLWERIDDKLNDSAGPYGLEDEQKTIQKKLYMADCYGLWDAFDYINAHESKKNHGCLWDYDVKHTCRLNNTRIDVLEILRQVINTQTLFDEDARIIHYAVDRYQNGIRRMDSDRFDDAIVRFTQIVEILCRYRIYQIAGMNSLINSADGIVSQADCLRERWSISKLIIFLFGQSWRYDRYDDDYYIIEEANMRLQITEYGYRDATEITDLIEARNQFVHVKTNPEWTNMQENAKSLKNLARQFLENFLADYWAAYCSLNDLLELHRFRR